MVADAVGEREVCVGNALQLDAAAKPPVSTSMQAHAPAKAAAPSGTQVDVQLHPAASETERKSEPGETSDPNLSNEVASLRAQLKSKESEIEFLREEIRAARNERGNVVQISNRMMEALETMVIGGKVDRLNSVESNPTGTQSSENG